MRISCNNNNQNIGVVKRGTIKRFSFNITNDSDKIFSIIIQNGCGCTDSKLELNPIPPGETTKLIINFDANKNSLGGPWAKVVHLSYFDLDEKENKTLTVNFTVTVEE
jgi:hypothetical protein